MSLNAQIFPVGSFFCVIFVYGGIKWMNKIGLQIKKNHIRILFCRPGTYVRPVMKIERWEMEWKELLGDWSRIVLTWVIFQYWLLRTIWFLWRRISNHKCLHLHVLLVPLKILIILTKWYFYLYPPNMIDVRFQIEAFTKVNSHGLINCLSSIHG